MTHPTETNFPALHDILQERLVGLVDLSLTLKHVHWNVVGENFISVHEMLDQMVDRSRAMSDAMAERLRVLGGSPQGTPQAIIDTRSWSDYPHAVAHSSTHLEELRNVYDGVIDDHRKAVATAGDVDPVTEDLLIGQTAVLEQDRWFISSFLGRAEGETTPS